MTLRGALAVDVSWASPCIEKPARARGIGCAVEFHLPNAHAVWLADEASNNNQYFSLARRR